MTDAAISPDMDTPKKVYRVAVIGCGSISANHGNAIIKSGNTLCALCDGGNASVLLKKLCIAVKYMLLPFKTVVDYGDGRQERDCTLSIITPSAHIHVPLSLGDKKTERFVANALTGAKKLLDENKSEYLAYCDETTEQLVFESKDDYVRRKYFDSGLVEDLEKVSADLKDK